jgi:hypothetical protein
MESSMMWQTDTCANWQDPSGEKKLRATQSVSTSVMHTYQQRDRRRVRRTTPSRGEGGQLCLHHSPGSMGGVM